MTTKYKFYASISLFIAAIVTTLPYFLETAGSFSINLIALALFCAPAFLLFTSQMRRWRAADEGQMEEAAAGLMKSQA